VPKPAAPSPSAPQIDPLTVLRAARDKLTDPRVQSIKARIVERIAIGGRRFTADGLYVQGTDLHLRFEYKILPETAAREGLEGSFLEVCDGIILWTQHQVGKKLRITRRDVHQILDTAKPNAESNLLALEFGLGGLPALLAALERSMKFDSALQEEVKGRKFTVITGSWNDATLEKFRANMGGRQVMPSHVPDSVRIYFEPDILFPRRIAYLKQQHSGAAPEPLVVLDFLDIVINGPIDPRAFDYVPPEGVHTIDVTNDYLKQLTIAPRR